MIPLVRQRNRKMGRRKPDGSPRQQALQMIAGGAAAPAHLAPGRRAGAPATRPKTGASPVPMPTRTGDSRLSGAMLRAARNLQLERKRRKG